MKLQSTSLAPGEPEITDDKMVDQTPESESRITSASKAESATMPRDHAEHDDPLLRGSRYYWVLFSLCFALLLGAMDSSIVATALVAIGSYFDDFIRVQWVVLAYLLTDLGFALIFARISDVIGRKWASVSAVAILTIGSLGAGLATSLNMLIGFRAIQGIGGAGVYALPLTVIPEITPAEKFGVVSAASGLVFTCSSILGPIIGGVITTNATWRWCFLFNVPCGVFAIAIMVFTWPKKSVIGQISWSQLDLPGAFLILAATVLTIFALQEAGSGTYSWSSSIIIGCLIGGGVSSIMFLVWIWYLSSRAHRLAPLFSTNMFKNRILNGAFAIAATSGFTLFVVLVELSNRLQIVNHRSAAQAGVDLLPLLVAAAVGSGLAGFLSSGKHNRSFQTITISSGLAIIGVGLLAYIAPGSSIPKPMYGYQAMLGLGTGGIIVSGTIAIKLAASKSDAAMAQGVQAQARLLGSNIGLALATIVLNASLDSNLAGIMSAQDLEAVKKSLNAVSELTPSQVQAVRESVADAFKIQLLICLGVTIVGLFCCALIWQKNPRSFKEMEEGE